jgi:hypothetical protein
MYSDLLTKLVEEPIILEKRWLMMEDIGLPVQPKKNFKFVIESIGIFISEKILNVQLKVSIIFCFPADYIQNGYKNFRNVCGKLLAVIVPDIIIVTVKLVVVYLRFLSKNIKVCFSTLHSPIVPLLCTQNYWFHHFY